MEEWLNLMKETIGHFEEGARSVRAFTDESTFIITRGAGESEYIVTTEAPGFPKERTRSLEKVFKNVFGIEARY